MSTPSRKRITATRRVPTPLRRGPSCSSDPDRRNNVTGRGRILTGVRPHFFSWLDNGLAGEEQRRRGAGRRKGLWLAGQALAILGGAAGTEERRGGEGWVVACGSRGAQYD